MDLKEAGQKKSENRHPWELARLEIVNKKLKTVLEVLNQNGGVVLDLGCGDTWFIENFSSRYPNIDFLAVDIAFTDELLSKLQSKYKGSKISVFRSLDDVNTDFNRSVDVVLLLDVIEHIEDDVGFLKWVQTFDFITDKTWFSITVPAYQWLFSAHDVFLDHYRRYTNTMLVKHIENAGLTKSEVSYFFCSLYFARILVWLKEKIAGRKKITTGLVEWTGGKWITSAIKFILMLDYKFGDILSKAGIKIPGLSNYILCRKSA